MKYKCKVVCLVWLLWTIAYLVDTGTTSAELWGSIVNNSGSFESCVCRCMTCKDCIWYHHKSYWSAVPTWWEGPIVWPLSLPN